MSLIKRIYEPAQPIVQGKFDLVVPLDYASLKGEKLLPHATISGLTKAARLVKAGTAEKIAWASPSRFGSPVEAVHAAKSDIVTPFGIEELDVLARVECDNSITEAERILVAAPHALRIIVICDWRHARRTNRIWRHFYDGELVILTTDTEWNEDHPSFWNRSKFMWTLGNLIHHMLLLVVGVERLRKVVHPVKK